ncbi:hypothetical protein CIRG_05718 [Coccidioides immitis RMSCC 2394]|uniref:Uncharacterized protein n=1 Tax=Coccidioides immitis RMSCC 2394 TaxID=404692 RepID=A0A0J7B7W8_COCIT|nr:hypothetical protein CIRG_05718 [Coccidioides immitis RMSCC 2394]
MQYHFLVTVRCDRLDAPSDRTSGPYCWFSGINLIDYPKKIHRYLRYGLSTRSKISKIGKSARQIFCLIARGKVFDRQTGHGPLLG